MCILLALVPTTGVISVKKKVVRKLSFSFAEVINDLVLAMKVIQVNLNYVFFAVME